MYIPKHFRINDKEEMLNFIRKNSFGMMISYSGGEIKISHVPFVVDDSLKILKGHIAKENDQWKTLENGRVKVVFPGPAHYISAEWYGERKPVPTWNYLAVHIEGTVQIISDKDEKVKLLDDLSGFFNEVYKESWRADWKDPYYISTLDSIVAFRVSIDKAEGKKKLSQNHPADKRANLVKNLRGLNDPTADQIADETEKTL